MAITGAKPIEKLVTGTRPGRALAHRFVAGDTLDEALAVARKLNEEGFSVSLDLLGEEVHDRSSARDALNSYMESLDRIAEEGLDANISVKPTQLGLAIDSSLAADAISALARRAESTDATVTIDMEDSRYTESTVELFRQGQNGRLGIALQAYLHRTPIDLERCVDSGGHIRLCKGAYVEDPSIAYQEFERINRAFEDLLRVLMEAENVKPAIATHNEKLLQFALELAPYRTAPFEFQMLYGVRKDLQHQLVAAGHPVRIYLPFGSQWYPYLTRRLAERPANALFLAKAIFRS